MAFPLRGADHGRPVFPILRKNPPDLLRGEVRQGRKVHIGPVDRFQLIVQGLGLAELCQRRGHALPFQPPPGAKSAPEFLLPLGGYQGVKPDVPRPLNIPAAPEQGQGRARNKDAFRLLRAERGGAQNHIQPPGHRLPYRRVQGRTGQTHTVDMGDHVRRGQVLVTMDNSEAARLKVNLDQIQREYNRATQLLKIGSGTQAQVDQLKAQLDASRTQYNNVIENTVLRSPVSGVVTARNFDPGDVTAGQPVLTIGQITPDVKIIINVTEADRAKFHAGMPVDVTFDACPGESYAAKVSRIYPAVDPQTRTFQAEVLIPNKGEKFFPGMFARVSVNHGTQENVVVSDRAVVKQTGSGNRYVYVLRGDKVTFNKVELGTRTDSGYEIISGVADGDTVVVAGQSRLADGVRVQLNTKKK